MKTIAEAIQLATNHTHVIDATEAIDLFAACGRILAKNAVADTDQPPFDKSAMDGYACKKADLTGPLKITETLAAGSSTNETIVQGHCAQIFTGAKIPYGADCVLMQESTLQTEHGDIVATSIPEKSNICYQGEDVKTGDVLIAAGHKIHLPDMAILASAGIVKPVVFTKPMVAIICSGDELVDATETPQDAKIRNTNVYQLWAQIETNGGIPKYYGIVPDKKDILLQTIQTALSECHMVITTGGASVGQYDLIPEVYTLLGAQIHFNGVNMQPGKPVVFASINGKPLWGLSGNPVSSYLQFTLLANSSLQKLCGAKETTHPSKHILADDLVRHKKGRELFVPIKINEQGLVHPIKFNGSAHIAALSGIYGFARLPAEQTILKAGEPVECITL
jgi:molybdopterin molybdotransferase